MNVLHVVVHFRHQRRARVDLPLVEGADDRPPVPPPLVQGVGGLRRNGRAAAGLPGIRLELADRQPEGHPGPEVVVDRLEVEGLLVVDPEAEVRVDRRGPVVAVPDVPVLGHVAREHGGVQIAVALPRRHAVLVVAVGPGGVQELDPVDVLPPAGLEMDHPAQRVVVVHGGGGAPQHLHPLHEPGIVDVQAREPVRLGLGDPVLVHLQIADAERVLGPGTADRDVEVARAVRLPGHHAGKGFQRFPHLPRRLLRRLTPLGGRERDPFRPLLRFPGDDADVRQLQLRCDARLLRLHPPLDDAGALGRPPALRRRSLLLDLIELLQDLLQLLLQLFLALGPFLFGLRRRERLLRQDLVPTPQKQIERRERDDRSAARGPPPSRLTAFHTILHTKLA